MSGLSKSQGNGDWAPAYSGEPESWAGRGPEPQKQKQECPAPHSRAPLRGGRSSWDPSCLVLGTVEFSVLRGQDYAIIIPQGTDEETRPREATRPLSGNGGI